MSTEIPQTPQKTRIETPTATETGRIVDPNGPERRGFTRREKLTATILTLGGLAGGIGAAEYFSTHVEAPAPTNHDNTSAQDTPTYPTEVSASASPTNLTPLETAKPTLNSKEQLIASLELSVDKYPDIQTLAKAIMSDRWTAWENQGATQENNDEFMKPNTNKTAGEFATEKATLNADIFPKAIFIKDYEKNPNLVTVAKRSVDNNAATLERTLITWDDSTRYKRTIDTSGEVQIISGSIKDRQTTFKVSWIGSSNAAETRIGTTYDKNTPTTETGTYTITAIVVDGKWEISNIQW